MFVHEWKRNWKALVGWTIAIAGMVVIVIVIFPEFSSESENVSELFSQMGSFSEAFGLNQLNMGSYEGYIGLEAGNVLGLGGSLFGAILGFGALAREEGNHTADFYLSLPISRTRFYLERLLAVSLMVVLLNGVCWLVLWAASAAIDEPVTRNMVLNLAALLLSQLEVCWICFGISAFLHRDSIPLAIGMTIVFYFINVLANLWKDGSFLYNLTPFGISNASRIYADQSLETGPVCITLTISLLVLLAGLLYYRKKMIR